MPFFETKSKKHMISAHKRVTTLKFGTAVAFVENNMELLLWAEIMHVLLLVSKSITSLLLLKKLIILIEIS